MGKYIASLTLAQIKILDCGRLRLTGFPPQLTQNATRISALSEMFDFVKCANPKGEVLFNVESKLDAAYPNLTRSVEDFVQIQLAAFKASGIKLNRSTYQSFDWRSLIRIDNSIPKSRSQLWSMIRPSTTIKPITPAHQVQPSDSNQYFDMAGWCRLGVYGR